MVWEWPRKREKKFSPEFRSYSAREENCEKNSKKIQKLKTLFPAVFLSKTGWDRPRKRKTKFTPKFFSYPTRARKFKKKKKIAKKLKKLKKQIPALFLSKMVWVWPRKREKNFSPEFRSYSTRARKFRKKYQKNSKN